MTEAAPPPPRGFPPEEFHARRDRAQALMAERDLDAVLLTTDADIRWATGFLTRFWESPTRPWFVILPALGDPVAVIPEIGGRLMRASWLSDIRTWPSPDYADDGLLPLSAALTELTPPNGRIGVPSGPETHLRLPLLAWSRLPELIGARRLTDDGGVMRACRAVKSEREIAKIRAACAIAGRAFARIGGEVRVGDPLERIFRRYQALCLEEGADWIAYLAGGAGPGGCEDVISPADATPLAAGDVLMLDAGVVHDGHFCDYDRNFSVGPPSPATADAHARLIEATRAGFDAARPGATAADLFAAMDAVLAGGAAGPTPGRLGHGLGLQLTEPPSLLPQDRTVLAPGMVLTLEPSLETAPGRLLVHEENIVIRERGAEWLTTPAPPEIPVVGA